MRRGRSVSDPRVQWPEPNNRYALQFRRQKKNQTVSTKEQHTHIYSHKKRKEKMKCRVNDVDLKVGGRMGSACHGNVGVIGQIQKEKKKKKSH